MQGDNHEAWTSDCYDKVKTPLQWLMVAMVNHPESSNHSPSQSFTRTMSMWIPNHPNQGSNHPNQGSTRTNSPIIPLPNQSPLAERVAAIALGHYLGVFPLTQVSGNFPGNQKKTVGKKKRLGCTPGTPNNQFKIGCLVKQQLFMELKICFIIQHPIEANICKMDVWGLQVELDIITCSTKVHHGFENFRNFDAHSFVWQFRMPETRNSCAMLNGLYTLIVPQLNSQSQKSWPIIKLLDKLKQFCANDSRKPTWTMQKSWVSHRGLSWLHCNHASVANLKCQRHRWTILLANSCLEAK